MTKDMTRLTDALYVTNGQIYDKVNQYFIRHTWPGIWLGIPILYQSQMSRDMTILSDTFLCHNGQGCDYVKQYFIFHKWPGIWQS
jgi:hypothetical protein